MLFAYVRKLPQLAGADVVRTSLNGEGSQCVACHMPKIEQTIADIHVRSHTFKLISPADTDALKIPNPCNVCHKDKSTEWATTALESWTRTRPGVRPNEREEGSF